MNHKITSILSLLLFTVIISGCKKLVEVDGPSTSVSSKNVYNDDATAVGAVTSLYVNMSTGSLGSPGELTSLSCIAGLSADELTYYEGAGDQTLSAYYQNDLNVLNAGGLGDYWGKTYQRLYTVNEALERLKSSSGLTSAVKQQLMGEVRFMRAFYYFYLVNLYGDVPLVLSTDYKVNAVIKRSTKTQVYNQIILDLKEAQGLLSENYLKGDAVTGYSIGSEERVRPTKWAAIVLLARAYLFNGEWANAEEQASLILTNTTQFHLEPLDKVFLKNNQETIWQLQPTRNGFNTQEGHFFSLPLEGPSPLNPVYLSAEFIQGLEINDQRRINWIGSINVNSKEYYFPYKYKVKQSSVASIPITEYTTVIRLAEPILIRSESRAQLNNIDAAISDLDQIRKRAGLILVRELDPTIGKGDLIKLILKEKQIEFFAEWGHRWLDLKRTNSIDEVMNKVVPQKGNGGAWKNYQKYYPISTYELQSNPSLTQTPGY